MGNRRSRVWMVGSRFIDLSVESCVIPTPKRSTTSEDIHEPQGASSAANPSNQPCLYLVKEGHSLTESFPRSEPLAEANSRFGADAAAIDMWRIRRDEITLLLGVVALVLVWYGVLWLAG